MSTTDSSSVRLGKHLGVVHDPRTLRARDFLEAPDGIKAPREHRIARTLHNPPMYANDQYGDCTCASQAHRINAQENSSGQHEIKISDADVLEAYAAVTGFRPDDPGTDNGAYELDVLNYLCKIGLGRERDGSRHTIGAFTAVNWLDHDEMRRAHYVFGGLKVCAALPISAQRQDVWDVTSGTAAEFGSWGGHSMYSVGYYDEGLLVYTWGREQLMTWAWVDKYVDEVYALVSEDYFRCGGSTPQGFSIEKLAEALRRLR